jgi:hypothetical protein
MDSARQLNPRRFVKIMKMAISFLETSSSTPQQDVSMGVVDPKNFRSNLVGLHDDDYESGDGGSHSGTE